MPGHVWTEAQKKALSEKMKAKRAQMAPGKTPEKKVNAKKVAKNTPKKVAKAKIEKPERKYTRKSDSMPAKDSLAEGVAFAYPMNLREIREHATGLAQINTIPGLSNSAKAALSKEIESTVELLATERKKAFGTTESESAAAKTAEAKTTEPVAEAKPVQNPKVFTPASAPEFAGKAPIPNGAAAHQA